MDFILCFIFFVLYYIPASLCIVSENRDQGCDQVHQLQVDCRPRPPNNPTSPFQGYQINH